MPEGEKVIFFLRDPISRFVSGFYSRKRQGLPRIFNPWKENEKIAFEEFSTPNQLALALSSADTEKRKRAQFAMRGIGHVRDFYTRWFESEDYFKSRWADIFFLGFQERLSEDFTTLKLKIGLSEDAELPSDDVRAHRSPKNVDKRLDDEAEENLKRWYIDDFRFNVLCKQLIEHPGLGRPVTEKQEDTLASARSSKSE